MPTRDKIFDVRFGGGWATDLGPAFGGGTSEGVIVVPFLVDGQDLFYELDGGPHKLWGATKLNSTAITETGTAQPVNGMFDYWRMGTSGTAVQRRICAAGTKILKEDLDGVWDDLFTGLEDDKIPSFCVFDDILIISTDSAVDVPRSWDQTTAQNLAGTPPNFAFAVEHKNHVFAAGVWANPSRLYYSQPLDPEDWTSAGSGSIDISPDDGDRITGLASHKNELWVFKGPYKGSIHRLTGSAEADWARTTFINGIGCAAHNTIFRYGDDLGFMGIDGDIHSLAATAAFGDFNQKFLSAPIARYIHDSMSHTRLQYASAATHPSMGIVIITVSGAGQSQNDQCLMMDYRFNPVRWALWPTVNAASVAIMRNSGVPRPFFGGYDGYVRRGENPNRSFDGTALSYKVTLPYLNFGAPDEAKTVSRLRVSQAPKGSYDLTLQWQGDNQASQSATVEQGGADILGPVDENEFTLDTSILGGGRYSSRFVSTASGEFKELQLQIRQSTLNEDAEVHGLGVHMTFNGVVTEAA